jgi:hypothetical protein
MLDFLKTAFVTMRVTLDPPGLAAAFIITGVLAVNP